MLYDIKDEQLKTRRIYKLIIAVDLRWIGGTIFSRTALIGMLLLVRNEV